MRGRGKILSSWHHRILGALNFHGPQSRSDLARLLGLSKASITSFARDLTEGGILDERERIFGSGRPAIALEVRRDAASFLGISLNSTPAQIVIVNACGQLIQRASFTLPWDSEEALDVLYAQINQIREDAAQIKGALMGIGITASSPSENKLLSPISLLSFWRETNSRQRLSHRVGYPIFVESDVVSLLICAYLFDETKQTNLSIALIGNDIASSYIVNHRFHYSHSSNGLGWLAKYPVKVDADPCPNLAQRCVDLQAVINIPAILNAAAKEGLICDLEGLCALAAGGDERALFIFQRAGGTLGVVLTQMVQFLDITHIIVIVDPLLFQSHFVQALKATFETFVEGRSDFNARLIVAPLDPEKLAVAAASVAAQQLFYGDEFPLRDQLINL